MVMSGNVDVSAGAAVKVAISKNPDFFMNDAVFLADSSG
jgi:hypothetical protein